MRAKDIMTTNIVSVSEEGSIDQAVELMLDNRISAIPVLDDDKRLLGLISEGDLMRRMRDGQAQRRSWWLELLSSEGAALDYMKARSELVADVMTRNVITVDEDTKVEDIALTLEQNRLKRVPVTKDGIAVGVVSRADLIQALALSRNGRLPVPKLEDETLRRQVLNAISTAPGGSVSSVSLQVENGSVTIWGTAEGEAVKQAIRVAAENVDGVRSVQVYMDKVPPWVYGI